MSTHLDDALEICLEALRTGADLERCLTLYPEIAHELRPTLETAIAVVSFAITVPSDAHHRSRTKVLQRLSELPIDRIEIRFFWLRRRLVFTAFVIATVFAVLGMGLITVSAQSLPGDALYPLKRTLEDVNLALASDTQARQKLENQYLQRRTDEVRSLLDLQRVESVSFEGVIETQSSREWKVHGIPVVLPVDTRILDAAEIGMLIEVKGTTQTDGKVLAHELRIRQVRLSGIVERITPEWWIIDGTLVQINERTWLDTNIRVQDQVMVLAETGDDGSYTAFVIVRLGTASLDFPPTPSVKEIETTETSTSAIETDGHADEIDFSGIVEAISGQSWTIEGQNVIISTETEVEDEIAVGDLVKVHARIVEDGTVTAVEIERLEVREDEENDRQEKGESDEEEDSDEQKEKDEDEVEEVEFEGILQSKSDTLWVISGTQVSIDQETEISGDPEVGDTVEIEAVRMPNGKLLAKEIDRKDD